MALKNVNKAWTVGRNRVLVEGSFRPNGSSAVASGNNRGLGWSVARTSKGLFTLTFAEKANELDSFLCGVRVASALPTVVQAGDWSASAKTMQMRIFQAGAGKSHLPLPLLGSREIAANAIQDLAAHGGLLASDSVPALERINGATDKALRLDWAATEVDEVQLEPIAWPADLDASEDVEVHLLVSKDGNTDTAAVIDIQAFEGIGDTEMGGNTQALDVAANTQLEVSTTLSASNIAGHPGFLNLALVPGAHANDAIRVHAAWLEYTSTQIGFSLADLASDVDNVVNFAAIFRNSSVDA